MQKFRLEFHSFAQLYSLINRQIRKELKLISMMQKMNPLIKVDANPIEVFTNYLT